MKLGVGFGTLLLILVVVGVVSYASLQKAVELSIMAGDKDRAVIVLRTIEARVNDQKAEVRGFLLDDSRQEEVGALCEQHSHPRRHIKGSSYPH